MNIYISDGLKERMDKADGVNWSAAATAAFEAELEKFGKRRSQKIREDVMQRQNLMELLLMNIESTAEWRAGKAEEYPDDERNAACAKALYASLDVVGSLSLNHSLFKKLAAICNFSDDSVCEWTEIENQMIARYGFDGDESPEGFPESLELEADMFISEYSEDHDALAGE